MITNIEQIVPRMLKDELRRVGKIDRDWVTVKTIPGTTTYEATTDVQSWVRKLWTNGSDAFGMWALATWLVDGPKLFRPTVDQCTALEQVEVNVELHEYQQPYPAILVDLPDDMYAPFTSVLCHRCDDGRFLTFSLFSAGHLDDVVTAVAVDGRPIEVSLQKYDGNLIGLAPTAGRALRVCANACLALANHGTHKEMLFAKAVASDRELAKEKSARGEKARVRLKDALSLVSFARDVKLHDTKGGGNGHENTPTGREVAPHWRRGHWRKQHHGQGNELTKLVLIKPVLVRADRFIGDASDTMTSYRSQDAKPSR